MSDTATVVTSETLQAFQFQRMGIDPDAAPQDEKTIKSEAKAIPDEESDEQHEEQAEQKEEGHKPNPKLQERFSKLTKQREEARQEAAAERTKAATLEARLAVLEATGKPAQAPVVDADARPNPSAFTDAFQYAEKLAEWSVNQAIKGKERADVEAQAKAEKATVVEGWNTRLAAVKAELPDFDTMVASSDVLVSDQVRDAILESDVGPRILYHLAANDEDAKKLTGMTAAAALRFIGRLEAKFDQTPAKAGEKPAKPAAQVSKAPAPIKPIGSTGSAGESSDGENLDFQKYKALRAAGKIK